MDNKTYIKSWKQTLNKDNFCGNFLLNNFPLFVPFGDKSFLQMNISKMATMGISLFIKFIYFYFYYLETTENKQILEWN